MLDKRSLQVIIHKATLGINKTAKSSACKLIKKGGGKYHFGTNFSLNR